MIEKELVYLVNKSYDFSEKGAEYEGILLFFHFKLLYLCILRPSLTKQSYRCCHEELIKLLLTCHFSLRLFFVFKDARSNSISGRPPFAIFTSSVSNQSFYFFLSLDMLWPTSFSFFAKPLRYDLASSSRTP